MSVFPSCDRPLRDAFDTALLDLDGVVYIGKEAVPHAVYAINAASSRGMKIAYVTNNAARPASEVAAHLYELGVHCTDADVVTSAQAGAHLLQQYLPPGSLIFSLGGPGVAIALRERGFEPVALDRVRDAVGVLQGFGPDLTWHEYAAGAQAIVRGAVWVATNLDLTIPTPAGIAPGNGSFVQLVANAAGSQPVAVGGKPERALIDESLERVGAEHALIIGDRLDTDIWAGHNSGLETLLVLTGVHGVGEVFRAEPHLRPTFIGRDLRSLAEPQLGVVELGTVVTCGGAIAEVANGELAFAGDDPIELLKACAALAWSNPQLDTDAALTRITSLLG